MCCVLVLISWIRESFLVAHLAACFIIKCNFCWRWCSMILVAKQFSLPWILPTQVMWPDLTLARTGTDLLVLGAPPDNCKSTSHTPAPSTQIQYTMISEAKWIYLNYVWVIVICINFCLLSRCIFLHLFCLSYFRFSFCETTIDFFMHGGFFNGTLPNHMRLVMKRPIGDSVILKRGITVGDQSMFHY